MKKTDFSPQFPTVWGAGADSAHLQYPIPGSSTDLGRASLTLGFPPATFVAPEAGGSFMFGEDMNGALRMLATAAQNYESGVFPPFSASFAQSVGGYPLGCVVADPSTTGVYWVSTADNNLTTPGASGASWQSLFANILPSQAWDQRSFIPSSGWSISIPAAFTATGSGCLMLCIASANIGGSGVQPIGCSLSISVDGTQLAADNTVESMSLSRTYILAPGAHTITVNYSTGSSSSSAWSSVGLKSSVLFMPLP